MNNEFEDWNKIQSFFKINFSQGDAINLNGILFLIGVQELGQGNLIFKKEDKLDLIHIAVCKLLLPFGYYRFEGINNEGWPIYSNQEKIPKLDPKEQTVFIKKAIIYYFKKENLIN